MKVKELMSKKLFTVGPEDMLDKVFFLFNFEAIRHLPVVDKGKLMGMLTSTTFCAPTSSWPTKWTRCSKTWIDKEHASC